MWKPLSLAIVFAAAGGMYYFLSNYEVVRQDGRIVILAKNPSESDLTRTNSLPVGEPNRKTLRLATFNLGPLDRTKLGSPLVAARLATLIRDFDIIAVQGIYSPNQGVVRDLVQYVNAPGGNYDFAVAPEVGAEPVESYSAILFDASRIEIDRATVQSVVDPSGRLRHHPLCALFRARGPAADEAFTFVLINVQVDPQRADMELDLLDDVYLAVAESLPGEDDIIMLGDLETDQNRVGQLGRIPNLAWAASDTVSTTQGTRLVDNILYNRRATNELTGRGGVVDLVRRLNLSIDEAGVVAQHMPVWVELSVFEGGQAGRIAKDGDFQRR